MLVPVGLAAMHVVSLTHSVLRTCYYSSYTPAGTGTYILGTHYIAPQL